MRLRETPEDFRVEELPLYAPSGEGGHTFVRVEKRLRTTEEVARDLARAAGVSPRDVGYAGRKDRRAVTTQWLSVPGLDPREALALSLPGARVLEAVPHPHKLRTGQLRGNRFEISLRGVDDESAARAARMASQLLRSGLPNRFGAQRFGRDGRNDRLAVALLRGERTRAGRREQRFLLSALQARVFNAALDERALPPHRLETGDLAVRHDSGGLFVVEDLARETPRAEAFEISPTGPIFGTRMPEAADPVAGRERALLERFGVAPASLRPPRGVRLRGARRPLRVPIGEWQSTRAGDVLQLRFALPAGSYASVLIECLFREPGADDVASRDVGPAPAVGSGLC
jgi:tRNA pseudouridine13 synthase